MASVELQSLSKSFGPIGVIHNVDVDLADGEFLALVGPSGCGKSTLLRIIAGLEDATDGEVLFDGKIVTDLNSRQRNVAMVFQSYALYPHMTVAKNIAFNLRLSGKTRPEIDARVADAARLLELTDLLSRRPYQLSGGQRQRVAMGRAIVRDPSVFLFDEPLSNLDAKLRVQMRTEIKALHQKVGTTSIYVTHDQIEAMTLADRIVVLNGGRVEQQGGPMELYNRPVNLFVAGFIGSPSMNFVEATAAVGGSGPEARFEDGTRIDLPASTAVSEGQSVVVGLRPEHLAISNGGDLCGTVQFVEPTGAQSHVTFSLGGRPVVALVDGMVPISVGDTLRATIPSNLVHVFDKSTGVRL